MKHGEENDTERLARLIAEAITKTTQETEQVRAEDKAIEGIRAQIVAYHAALSEWRRLWMLFQGDGRFRYNRIRCEEDFELLRPPSYPHNVR